MGTQKLSHKKDQDSLARQGDVAQDEPLVEGVEEVADEGKEPSVETFEPSEDEQVYASDGNKEREKVEDAKDSANSTEVEEVEEEIEAGAEIPQSSRLHKMPDWVRYGFPPPEYLRFNFVGLNISDHSVKVCKSVTDHDYYLIEFIDTLSIPEGVIVNGEIQDAAEVVKVLKKVKSTFGVEFVRVSVPEEKIYLATFSIPPTSPDKLRSVVEFHIGDHIPLSVDEIQFDYNVVKRTKSGKITQVVATAIAKNEAQELTTILTDSGLVPLSMEVEAQAVARVVLPPRHPKTALVLDIGRSRTGISIIKNQVVRYTTTVTFGGDHLVQLIAELRDIDPAEAEKVKRTSGLQLSKYTTAEQQKIEDFIADLVEEIRRRENYWINQSGEEIDEVLLVGGNASTPHLVNYLQSKTDKIVKVPDVWQNVYHNKESERLVSDNEALGYAAVVGLAINEQR